MVYATAGSLLSLSFRKLLRLPFRSGSECGWVELLNDQLGSSNLQVFDEDRKNIRLFGTRKGYLQAYLPIYGPWCPSAVSD